MIPGQAPPNMSEFQLDGMAWFLEDGASYPEERYYWLDRIEPIEDEV